MYTLLRIEGDRASLEHYQQEFAARCGEARAALTRRGDLTVDLSNEDSWDEHQWQVENLLGKVAPLIESVRKDGCSVYVDCGVYVPSPSGSATSVVVRTYRHRSSLIEQLARLGLDYEITVYVEPPPDPSTS